MQNKEQLLYEYTDLLSSRFKNSNKYIVEIKSAQAALKKMELEKIGTTIDELRHALSDARKDAVCFLVIELSDFLGDQQMVKPTKATKSFMQWGIKQIITKLKELGVEMTEKEIKELTIDACIDRIAKLKDSRAELEGKLAMLKYYSGVYAI